MADNVLYAQSMESQEVSVPFINRSVQYITDLNNGSYGSGQILIDSSSLSNSGRWCAYNEAYLELPLVAALYPSTTVTNFIPNQNLNFSAGLKNGINLIHSLSCELNNANVIQLTPYTNFYLNYKLLTTLSQDDLVRSGPTIGFYPDSSDSWSYSSATEGSVDGKGSCNNKTFGWQNLYPSNGGRIYTSAQVSAGASPVTISTIAAGGVLDSLYTTNFPDVNGTALSTGNFGLFQRTKNWAYNVSKSQYTNLLTEASAKTLFKNYFENASATYGAKVWRILVHIKLRHVSDLFQQLPLSRGLYFRWIVNLNLGTATLTPTGIAAVGGATGAGGYTGAYGQPATTAWKLAAAPTLTNATFPLQFASAAPGEPNDFLDKSAQATWYLGCGIHTYSVVQNSVTTTFSHQQNTVRMYVPCYTMSAQAESAYLQMNGPAKTIIYEDILQYNVSAVGAGSQVNQLITNGVVSPTKIVIVPMFNATSNDGLVSPHQSPFASEPGTTSPLTALTNLQVLLSGQTVFMLQEQYDFQNWVDETSRSGLNGGITDGLSSGLINEYMWGNNYRYYTIDVERRTSDAESVVPKSIQLLFQNLSTLVVDYYVFVVLRRSFSINLSSGALVA